MSLHDKAISFVAKRVNGHRNYQERIVAMDRSFVPDVMDSLGGMHEVELMRHKFLRDFTNRYSDAIQGGLPRKRNFVSLWLVIPNFDGITQTFDAVRGIVQTKTGFEEVRFLIQLAEAKKHEKREG